MAAQDHVKSDDICIWCHDRWPCETVKIVQEVRKQVAKELQAWADTMPSYTPPKGGTTGRAVALAAAAKVAQDTP